MKWFEQGLLTMPFKKKPGIHKKPIYGGRGDLITDTAAVMFGEFLKILNCMPKVISGAAQNMDLFPNTGFLHIVSQLARLIN